MRQTEVYSGDFNEQVMIKVTSMDGIEVAVIQGETFRHAVFIEQLQSELVFLFGEVAARQLMKELGETYYEERLQ